MKEIFFLILAVVVFIICGNTTVQFNPFKIQMETWHRPLAAVLLFAAMFIYDTYEGKYNYKKGFKDGINHVINETKDESRKD